MNRTAASRDCPVCETPVQQAEVFVEATLDPSRITGFSFASRKEPEYMSHRMMQCPTCDLVYVDQPPQQTELAREYHQADYDSAVEADDAARAYIQAIAPALAALPARQSALEIGAGTGVFLEHLRQAGFSTLVGIEPSAAAIAAAPAERRRWLRECIFDEADFEPASFDLICCFMTMEHVLDPRVIAGAAMRLLRPGGAFVTVTHDYRSAVNRAMGKRSPIIDIEHMQLFSSASARALFDRCGYQGVRVEAFVNTYRLHYWLRLLPLPRPLKRAAAGAASRTGLDERKLGFNVGNIVSAGFKPL